MSHLSWEGVNAHSVCHLVEKGLTLCTLVDKGLMLCSHAKIVCLLRVPLASLPCEGRLCVFITSDISRFFCSHTHSHTPPSPALPQQRDGPMLLPRPQLIPFSQPPHEINPRFQGMHVPLVGWRGREANVRVQVHHYQRHPPVSGEHHVAKCLWRCAYVTCVHGFIAGRPLSPRLIGLLAAG